MKSQLSSQQIEVLLQELCVRLGFCLPPNRQAHLSESPPTEIDAFTDAVIHAEGLDPQSDMPIRLRRDVRAIVAEHFRKAENHS